MQSFQFANWAAAYLFSLIAVLIIYYLLQGKRKQIMISSIMLWQNEQIQEKSTKPRWSFKPDILFFLQLLILILLITALMKPHLLVDSAPHIVIVIDRSASMQAVDVSPDRFTVSIERAVGRIQRQEEGAEFALISADGRPEVLLDFTNNKNKVIKYLKDLEVTDMALAEVEALNLAFTKLGSIPGKILFYTDHDISKNQGFNDRLEIIRTGTLIENIAITDLDVRRISRGIDEYQIMVEVSNFTSQNRNIPLIIEQEEQIINRQEVLVRADKADEIVFDISAEKRTPLTIKLDADDSLQVDNYAYTVIGTGENLKFLKIGPENYFLSSALMSQPEIELINREQVYGAEYKVFDLVIYDRISPPGQINGKSVFIKSVPDFLQENYQETLTGFYEVSEWQQQHPLLEFVNLNQLRVKNMQRLIPPANAIPVIESAAGPLLIAGENAELKWLYFAFAIQDSTFPLQVSFPVFLDNMIKWFFPQIFVPNYSWIRTGQEFSYLPRGDKELENVSFKNQQIAFNKGISQYIILDTDYTGFYQLEMNDGSRDYVGLNLLSTSESDPDFEIKLSSLDNFTGEDEKLWKQLWPYMILLTILFLLIEWYYYHKPDWSDSNAGGF